MPVADIFQKHWTVKESISYFKLLFTDFDVEKCLRLLEEMNITTKQTFKQMSSGTLGKAKLIFTLSRQVPLYLLDEPFANIDLIAREEIYAIILREFNEKSTMILSTHFLNEVEMLQGADNMPGKWQLLIFLGQQTILNLQAEGSNCS